MTFVLFIASPIVLTLQTLNACLLHTPPVMLPFRGFHCSQPRVGSTFLWHFGHLAWSRSVLRDHQFISTKWPLHTDNGSIWQPCSYSCSYLHRRPFSHARWFHASSWWPIELSCYHILHWLLPWRHIWPYNSTNWNGVFNFLAYYPGKNHYLTSDISAFVSNFADIVFQGMMVLFHTLHIKQTRQTWVIYSCTRSCCTLPLLTHPCLPPPSREN